MILPFYNLFSKLADVLSMVRPDVTLIEGVEGTIYGHYPVTSKADTCVKPFRVLIGAIIALALAKLKGSTSRVPNPFCHLFKVV